MLIKPYYETDLGRLYHGDCLEIMPNLGIHADALITDPPFAFAGGISNGRSSAASDQFFSHWWKAVAVQLSKTLKPEASGFVWCDWRSARVFAAGFETLSSDAAFKVSQMLYHFREMPGMGAPFRSSVDMIAYLRGPKHKDPAIENTTLNFISEYWYYGKHEFHPTEKSPSIAAKLINWCSKEGDLIIDPFSGSATVASACEKNGRRWVAIEVEEGYCEIAAKRIASERKQLNLFAA